jgi:hypothetical protein
MLSRMSQVQILARSSDDSATSKLSYWFRKQKSSSFPVGSSVGRAEVSKKNKSRLRFNSNL